jgi:DNA-directed RNA polymerase specialized sigma24 family protein
LIWEGRKVERRIPNHVRKTIEDAIANYRLGLVTLEERRQEALSNFRGLDYSRRQNPGDPTFAAVARLQSPDILLMEWMCGAIRDVYEALSAELKEVVRVYYWEGRSHYDAARRLGIGESTLRRHRELIVRSVYHRLQSLRANVKRNALRTS